MDSLFKKIRIFKDRLQIAVNFFDIFNEKFEPTSFETPLDLSKCFLPLISSPKNLIQKSNISLNLINSYFNLRQLPKTTIHSKERVMKKILNSYFSKKRNLSAIRYSFEYLCDIVSLHDFNFLQTLSLCNFEEELQYKALDESTLHQFMDQLYLLGKKHPDELNLEDGEFLMAFFADFFLVNFTVALTFLLMNMMFFLMGFNDAVLKKIYMSNKEDPELSIVELLGCKEFNVIKEFAIDFLQNKDSVYYSFEIFSKYHQKFLEVVRNTYYLEDYARILLYSKINLGCEKINIILGFNFLFNIKSLLFIS